MSEINDNKEKNSNEQKDNNELKNKEKEKKTPPKKRNFKNNIFWVYGIVFLGILAIQFFNFSGTPETVQWTFVRDLISNKEVYRISVVNDKKAEIYINPELLSKQKYANYIADKKIDSAGPHYYYNIISAEIFNNQLEELQKDFSEDDKVYFSSEVRKDIWKEALSWLLPIAVLVLLWFFVFRRMGGGGGMFNIGKSKAKEFDKEDAQIKINFGDVAGLVEAKQEISEIVDFLKTPDKYTKLGGKIPKGALLIGPPGTGKTLLAKAVAGEAGVPFFSMSGSDFVEMFVGVGASRVRDLFAQAKSKAPCIIFIDEIDAIGRSRSTRVSYSSNDERENTLNQLLTEMDGFDTNTGVIILAATNRADILDSALMRAGRFDRQVMIELPDLIERAAIFKVHLAPIKTETDLDVDFLSKQTPGFSGADIANVCNEAALIAARYSKDFVDKQDFLDAIDRIIGGLEKKNKIITLSEKKTIAYHEAGHAAVGWLLEHAHPLIKVTIVPRGKALGAAWYLPEERQLTTKEQLLDEICATLAGRASEEIFFDKISTGALNDLERVSKQAHSMVAFLGMSDKIGNISYYDSSGQSEYNFQKPYSEKTAEIIDNEIKLIIEASYQKAKTLILENKEKMIILAERLLQKEVIFTEDVEEILGKRKFSNHRTEEIMELNKKPEIVVDIENK